MTKRDKLVKKSDKPVKKKKMTKSDKLVKKVTKSDNLVKKCHKKWQTSEKKPQKVKN